MRGFVRTTLLLLASIALVHSTIVFANIELGSEDGWKTWQVEAIDDAPEMCCFNWRNGEVSKQSCHLDRDQGWFVSRSEPAVPGSTVQIFVLLEAGTIKQLRALSSSCSVTANRKIADLGPMNSDESVSFLRTMLPVDTDIASDAIAAIAVHIGADATRALLDIAHHDDNSDRREDAIFWMGQARIDETATVLKNYALTDRNPEVREHAAFAYSQSKAVDVSELLIQQGKSDSNPGVRAQAWFWLAESGAPESEVEIGRALRNDPDDDVREEAVFALSELPGDRAVLALVSVLEDKTCDFDVREQALFWLTQTESEKAFEYIDRLLSKN